MEALAAQYPHAAMPGLTDHGDGAKLGKGYGEVPASLLGQESWFRYGWWG